MQNNKLELEVDGSWRWCRETDNLKNKKNKKLYMCHVPWRYQKSRAYTTWRSLALLPCSSSSLHSSFVTQPAWLDVLGVVQVLPRMDPIRTSWRSNAGGGREQKCGDMALCCWIKTWQRWIITRGLFFCVLLDHSSTPLCENSKYN